MPSIKLAAEPTSVSPARRFVERRLEGVAVDRDVATLLVSELASNVVRHAATDFEIVVEVAATVRIEVRDGAAVTEAFRDLIRRPPRQVDASSPGGRGWMLVSTLAQDFGLIDHGADGKSLWFELAIDRTNPAEAS
ncbi:MAG: ATP-binding protein [Actinomycetota bacterium]|nr:ATP-binding protein [Actinomycetota bacterium]